MDRGRRRLLSQAATLAGAAIGADGWLAALAAQAPSCDEGPWGELVGVLPLYGPGAAPVPLGRMVGGDGLDARQFTDLSTLEPGRLVTPVEEVYVRTAAPAGLDHDPASWTIQLGDVGDRPAARITAAALAAEASSLGAHVMECAGNTNPQNFGLMSAVEFDGVRLSRVVAALPRPAGATALLVSGADHTDAGSGQSQPGASWVLPADALAATQPSLAVRMNGRPLTPDHGAPVRLVVPGWYGCAWIKWVRQIRWVSAEAPATSQMVEFATRTHQEGRPALARDYAPPAIDTAAMPVRVEHRRIGGRTEYRIVGIVWGGTSPVDRLLVRFGPRDPGRPLAVCPAPATHRTWSLWTYRWRPEAPGFYDIGLRVADPAVRTRRLDISFYVRRVRIDEI
jgi:DMSO/TMAO reductase YedYZ molybdopterin-dependent catalytic subunit